MEVIVTLVFVVILLYGIKEYQKGNKHKGILVYFFFVSHGFYLIPDAVIDSMPINKLIDYGTVYILFVVMNKLLLSRKSMSNYFKKFGVSNLFKILFVYLTILFVWTVLSGAEQFGYSLKVYRNYFGLLSFILFAELNTAQIKWVFKKVMIITSIACILFVLQPLLRIKLLTGGVDFDEGVVGRYRNIPYLAYFFLVYATVTLRLSKLKSVLFLLLFIVSLVLTQHRGIMIGYILTVCVYLLLEGKGVKIMQYGLIAAIFFIAFGSIITERFERADTGSDFETLLDMDFRKAAAQGAFDSKEGGTFTFRVMLLVERAVYLIEHPQYLLQGVGVRHEDSPNTIRDFSFSVSSVKNIGYGYNYPQQLDTGDLVWATPLIKFGLVGLFLYLAIAFKLTTFFFKYRKANSIGKVALCYYLLLIFTSFKNDQLFDNIHLFMIFLLYHYIKLQYENNNTNVLERR